MIKASMEYLHHLLCDQCKNWFSYASSEKDYRVENMYCPHCGHHGKVEYIEVD